MTRSAIPVLFALFLAGCSGSDPSSPSGGVTLPGAAFTIPLAISGSTYAASVEPTAGTPPYVWTVGTAGLPPGLTAAGGDASLEFSGTPTTPGQYDFGITVEDADNTETSATATCWVSSTIDLNGTWQFSIVVTAAEGACDGEEGESSAPAIAVTQNASTVTASGFLGTPSNQLMGTLTGSRVTVSGTYSEDGGMTTATYALTLFTPDRMEGVESWEWDADGMNPAECPDGRATVRANRMAP